MEPSVREGNEAIDVTLIEVDGEHYKVYLTRTKVRGDKTPERVALHFNAKKLKLTSWPKKWSERSRTALQEKLATRLGEPS